MISNASRAFPAWAMPALVTILLAAPMAGYASEGNDMALSPPQAAMAAATAPRIEAPAPAPAPAAPPAAPAAVVASPRPATPAPRPIAAGPVWTDASGVWRQGGIASWYGGKRWHGKLTASGVRYDEAQLTAAHASLPIGSRVRVTVADTGHSVVVTINDRPGTRRRIIDLSRAAAGELGILARGIAQVTLSPV